LGYKLIIIYKKIYMKHKFLIVLAALPLVFISCSKLDENLNAELTEAQIGSGSGGGNVGPLLDGLYSTLRDPFQGQGEVYALWEMTTDELIGPTRGGDWDDNGAWRVLHSHRFDGENAHVKDVFRQLNGIVYSATDLLRFGPTPQQAAEARLIRALAQFLILDGWDQVPYREPGESTILPPKVRKGTEALTYIIGELNAILPNLPAGPATKANKDAARVLLMKCYLNKGAIANRATPTFDNADMQQVITLADAVIANPAYTFSPNYFDNFAPKNGTIGKENIWTQENIGGTSSGGIRSHWHSTMHYNQQPSGWNGFTTLSDFYNKFEAADKRRGVAYPTGSAVFTNPGNRVNVGMLVGQQYDMKTDAPLKDRTGAPLIFTPEIKIIEKGTNLEVTGIRAYKYPIDFQFDDNGNVDNDFVIFRLGDVMLMKAEAQLRSGNAAGGLTIVNALRTNRSASALASLTTDNLLDERSREMYLEGWRRQDLIRFGKFLQAWQEKAASDPRNLLFPIPNGQLAANPNLKQNPGH
jgi:starch-binding outer membrane protein, SusD/RagB family